MTYSKLDGSFLVRHLLSLYESYNFFQLGRAHLRHLFDSIRRRIDVLLFKFQDLLSLALLALCQISKVKDYLFAGRIFLQSCLFLDLLV